MRLFQKDGDVSKSEEAASVNVQRDLDYFEAELKKNGGSFLMGSEITLADCLMEFTVEFILTRKLGTLGKDYPRLQQYIKDCHATDTLQKALKKTGHKL